MLKHFDSLLEWALHCKTAANNIHTGGMGEHHMAQDTTCAARATANDHSWQASDCHPRHPQPQTTPQYKAIGSENFATYNTNLIAEFVQERKKSHPKNVKMSFMSK